MLPQKSGWEVARTLRKDPATKDINAPAGGLYEADGVIDKPYEFDQLSKLIDKALGR